MLSYLLSARSEDHMGTNFLSGWSEYDKSFEHIEEYIIACFSKESDVSS